MILQYKPGGVFVTLSVGPRLNILLADSWEVEIGIEIGIEIGMT